MHSPETIERGRALVRTILIRAAYFSTYLAVYPALTGSGEIKPTSVGRLAIIVLICGLVYRGRPTWSKWLLVPTAVGAAIGGVGALLTSAIDVWGLIFVAIILLYGYQLSRLFWHPDAKAFLEHQARTA